MKKIILITIVCLLMPFLSYALDFTKESFQGNYAGKASISPKVVGMAVGTADGNGNFTVSGTISAPSLFGQRVISTISMEAALDVNPDGTGIVSYTATYEDGSSEDSVADFVVMEAKVVDGVKVATEIFIVDRTSGFLGFPATFIYKRLPD